MLIDWFDKRRSWGTDRNPILNKLKIYGIWNRLIDIIANTILPIYFNLTKNKPKNRLNDKGKTNSPQVIVSLTSFPKRLQTLHLVIESIFRQSVKPDKIVLYLTKSQVPDIEALPQKLLDQRNRGLEIILCPDEIRSHTKYFYAFQQFPNDIVITVDDDLFYRSDLIENHLKFAKEYPDCIIANWVKEIIPGKYKYTEWPDLSQTPKVGKNMLILGVGSVMYPPHSVHPDIFNVENIKNLTLTADDVWISAMILKQGTYVCYTAYRYNHLPIIIKNNVTLLSGNYVRNQLCIDAINTYYLNIGEQAPFINIPTNN